MKITFTLLMIVVFLLSSCQSQTPMNTADFGKYHKIDNYNIWVPFSGQPNISPKQSNQYISYLSYQYAFPKAGDDINNLYGVDVIKLKYDSLFKSDRLKVEFAAGQLKLMYEKVMGGQFISEKITDYHGSFGLHQKIKMKTSNLGDFYIQALYFPYKDIIVRMFTFTPLENEDNQKIKDYYETIKFE